MSMYPIVILAGGLATRLRPMTETIPKSLMPINGQPFIFHQLRLLASHGMKEVVLCVGFLGDKIEQAVGEGTQFGLQVRYVYDGDVLLGTGGALKRAEKWLNTPFFVLYGDSYLDCDYQAVQAAFAKSGQQALMTVYHNQGQWDTSNVEYAEDRIITYDKKTRSERMHYIDYGLGILSHPVLATLPAGEPFDLATLYQRLLSHGQLAGFEVKNRFYEVGSFAGIKDLEYYLSRHCVYSESICNL